MEFVFAWHYWSAVKPGDGKAAPRSDKELPPPKLAEPAPLLPLQFPCQDAHGGDDAPAQPLMSLPPSTH